MTYQPHQSEDATLKPVAGDCADLRDYFAAKALPQFATMDSKAHQAIAAYELADEMMKVRELTGAPPLGVVE